MGSIGHWLHGLRLHLWCIKNTGLQVDAGCNTASVTADVTGKVLAFGKSDFSYNFWNSNPERIAVTKYIGAGTYPKSSGGGVLELS